MMVYEWGTKAKSTIIITNITRESGDKITVAVKLERNGEEMTINEIASIHGKEGQLFISDMISEGEHNIDNSLKYVQENRKEVLDWLGLDSPKESASLTNEELHIAKVLQTFKNPAIIEQKNEKKTQKIENSLDLRERIKEITVAKGYGLNSSYIKGKAKNGTTYEIRVGNHIANFDNFDKNNEELPQKVVSIVVIDEKFDKNL